MLAVRSTPSSSTSRTEVAPIAIMPTSERYISQIVDVDRACYPISDADVADSVNYYRSQLANFADGHYVAVDGATDRVVGYTVAMRVDFDPAQPLLHSWYETTNYG